MTFKDFVLFSHFLCTFYVLSNISYIPNIKLESVFIIICFVLFIWAKKMKKRAVDDVSTLLKYCKSIGGPKNRYPGNTEINRSSAGHLPHSRKRIGCNT